MTKEEIKQSVKMPEILSRYGLKPNRAGFICCPFTRKSQHPAKSTMILSTVSAVESAVMCLIS